MSNQESRNMDREQMQHYHNLQQQQQQQHFKQYQSQRGNSEHEPQPQNDRPMEIPAAKVCYQKEKYLNLIKKTTDYLLKLRHYYIV